jgi:hypothetical protein
MKRIIPGVLFIVLIVLAVPAWRAMTFSQAGAPPNIAFDIPKTDIDLVLKNAPPSPPDRRRARVESDHRSRDVSQRPAGPRPSVAGRLCVPVAVEESADVGQVAELEICYRVSSKATCASALTRAGFGVA